MAQQISSVRVEPHGKPVGVSGWLLLFVVGVSVSSLSFLFRAVLELLSADHAVGQRVPLMIALTLVGWAAIFALFWFRDRRGPLTARGWMVLLLVAGIAAAFAPSPAMRAGEIVVETTRAERWSWLLQALLYNAVWQRYFSVSKRVRATYYSSRPRRPRLALCQIACLAVFDLSFLFGSAAVTTLQKIVPGRAERIVFGVSTESGTVVLPTDLEVIINRLRRRLGDIGIEAPQVDRDGTSDRQIVVVVPSSEYVAALIDWLTARNGLEFKEVVTGPFPSAEAAATNLDNASRAGTEILQQESDYWIVRATPLMTGDDVVMSRVKNDEYGRPGIILFFTEGGGRRMGEYSRQHLGSQLAIVLNNRVLSAPKIENEFLGRDVRISGNFSLREATSLAYALKAKQPLPVKLHVIGSETIESNRWVFRQVIRLALFSLVCVGAVLVLVFVGRSEGREPPNVPAPSE